MNKYSIIKTLPLKLQNHGLVVNIMMLYINRQLKNWVEGDPVHNKIPNTWQMYKSKYNKRIGWKVTQLKTKYLY